MGHTMNSFILCLLQLIQNQVISGENPAGATTPLNLKYTTHSSFRLSVPQSTFTMSVYLKNREDTQKKASERKKVESGELIECQGGYVDISFTTRKIYFCEATQDCCEYEMCCRKPGFFSRVFWTVLVVVLLVIFLTLIFALRMKKIEVDQPRYTMAVWDPRRGRRTHGTIADPVIVHGRARAPIFRFRNKRLCRTNRSQDENVLRNARRTNNNGTNVFLIVGPACGRDFTSEISDAPSGISHQSDESRSRSRHQSDESRSRSRHQSDESRSRTRHQSDESRSRSRHQSDESRSLYQDLSHDVQTHFVNQSECSNPLSPSPAPPYTEEMYHDVPPTYFEAVYEGVGRPTGNYGRHFDV